MKRTITHILLLSLLISLHGNLGVQGQGSSLLPSQSILSQSSISLRLRADLNGQKSKLSDIVLSPDARILAAAKEDGKTELWNTETGQLIANLDGRIVLSFYHSFIRPIEVFSHDSSMLVTMNGKEAKIWDAATGKLKHVLKGHEKEIRSVAFSPDNKSLATGCADGTVKLWNTKTGQLNATLAAYRIKKYPQWRIISKSFAELLAYVDVSFSPDSKRLLTIPYKQATKLWDSATGQLEAVLGEKNSHAKFSPNGRFILTQRYVPLFTGDLWETETGQLKATLTLPAGDAEFSPDENWLGPVEHQEEKGLLDLRTLEVKIPLNLNKFDFYSWILFSPDNRKLLLASGLYGHRAVLFDIPSGKEAAEIPIVAKRGFDFISDYLTYVERLRFHPSSRILMGANHDVVRFWDAETGEQIKEIAVGRDPAMLSSDGKLLVTASKDKRSILLWEVSI